MSTIQNWWMCSLIALLAGTILDFIIGDPHWMYHPIRLVGHLISGSEKLLRRLFPKTTRGEWIAGVFLVVLVTGITTGVTFLLVRTCYHLNWIAGLVVESILSYQILAVKALKTESMKVYDELKRNDLPGARTAVSMIVGRDTKNLSEQGVAKAAVETVAENASDGVIAPMLYLALGGATLGFFYKAVNTMDSMVGYKNDRYLYFGRAAAKFDDVLNYLPARISAWMMIFSAAILGMQPKKAVQIYFRDRYHHASPNSAQTEAVMAGALGVQLAGNAWYFGKLYEKPYIGDATREIEIEDVKRSNRLLYVSAIVSVMFFAGIKCLILKAAGIL